MVVERAKVSLGVRIQTVVEQLGDDFSLDMERSGSDVHQIVESLVEVFLVSCQVSKSRQVERDDTDRTCRFA